MEPEVVLVLRGEIARADRAHRAAVVEEGAALHDDRAVEDVLLQRAGFRGTEHPGVHEAETPRRLRVVRHLDSLNLAGYRETLLLAGKEDGPLDAEAACGLVGNDGVILAVDALARGHGGSRGVRGIKDVLSVLGEVKLAVTGEAVFLLTEIPSGSQHLCRGVRTEAAPAEPVDNAFRRRLQGVVVPHPVSEQQVREKMGAGSGRGERDDGFARRGDSAGPGRHRADNRAKLGREVAREGDTRDGSAAVAVEGELVPSRVDEEGLPRPLETRDEGEKQGTFPEFLDDRRPEGQPAYPRHELATRVQKQRVAFPAKAFAEQASQRVFGFFRYGSARDIRCHVATPYLGVYFT